MVVADPEANATEMVRLSALASGAGAQVVVFPELSITGYTAGDLFFSLSTLIQGAEKALLRLLRETAPLPTVIAVGLPVARDGRLFNVAALCQEGRLLGLVPKTFVPNYKEYYEERWFSSARDAVSDEAMVAGQRVPSAPTSSSRSRTPPRWCSPPRCARTSGRPSPLRAITR